jgi:hypothetical protein
MKASRSLMDSGQFRTPSSHRLEIVYENILELLKIFMIPKEDQVAFGGLDSQVSLRSLCIA